MLYGLALPPYNEVKEYEGGGNYAISKYYRFPFNLFYCKKFKLITSLMQKGKIYRNILDYGSGKAELFKTELSKHALQVKCIDKYDKVDPRWKFDVVVCASVLEFTSLYYTFRTLSSLIAPNGILIVSSPMDTWLTRLYFTLIGDHNKRHGHQAILEECRKHFIILKQNNWFDMYFSFKAIPIR